jgi:hyperosmotically inducible protein
LGAAGRRDRFLRIVHRLSRERDRERAVASETYCIATSQYEYILNTGSVAMNSLPPVAKAVRVCCALLALGGAVAASSTHAADTSKDSRSTGAVVDDSAITAKVKAALIGDDQVKAFDINVDTFHGKVTLTGAVDNAGQIERARTAAQNVPGVKSVESRLTIKK